MLHHTTMHRCRFISPTWTRWGKPNQTELQKMNSRPTCTGAGLCLLLGLGRENQSEIKCRKMNHTNVHWCKCISPAWTRWGGMLGVAFVPISYTFLPQFWTFSLRTNGTLHVNCIFPYSKQHIFVWCYFSIFARYNDAIFLFMAN